MASPPNKRTHKDLVIDVGQKVRHLRRKLSLSIGTLSKRSGLSTAAIQKIETNHRVPTITSLMKIANAHVDKFEIAEGPEPVYGGRENDLWMGRH